MADIVIDSANVPRKIIAIDSTGVSPTPPTPPAVDWIDMGTSVLWRRYNVGVDAEPTTLEEWQGNLYAWGELSPKSSYSWDNYRFYAGNDKFTKYTTSSEYAASGTPDYKKILDPQDDIATVLYGSDCRIPKESDWSALLDACYTPTIVNNYLGISGLSVVVFKSKTTNNELVISCRTTPVKGVYQHAYLATKNLQRETAKVLAENDYFNSLCLDFENGMLSDMEFDTFYGRYVGFQYQAVKVK